MIKSDLIPRRSILLWTECLLISAIHLRKKFLRREYEEKNKIKLTSAHFFDQKSYSPIINFNLTLTQLQTSPKSPNFFFKTIASIALFNNSNSIRTNSNQTNIF